MRICLKAGKVESTIKTTFGGVAFIEGEEQHIDDTKILPEERAKVLKDFDIIDHRGCEWAGGKKKQPGNTQEETANSNVETTEETTDGDGGTQEDTPEGKGKGKNK